MSMMSTVIAAMTTSMVKNATAATIMSMERSAIAAMTTKTATTAAARFWKASQAFWK
jgi:hypothetical protein